MSSVTVCARCICMIRKTLEHNLDGHLYCFECKRGILEGRFDKTPLKARFAVEIP